MPRQLVSVDRLLGILNERLSQHDICDGCQFQGPVRKLREPDDEGCNWSREVFLRCSGVPGDLCGPVADRVVYEVTQEFNVSW